MSPTELHDDAIVIDGLIIAKWNRELLEDMRRGGLTAAGRPCHEHHAVRLRDVAPKPL
mgnify:CR=1 FL=1